VVSRRSVNSTVLVVALALTGLVSSSGTASAQSRAATTELSAVSCVDATLCIASGVHTSAAGIAQPVIENWTQRVGWTLMKVPSLPSAALAVSLGNISCSGRDFCMALGSYVLPATDYWATIPYGFVWHGSRWSRTSLPQPVGAVGSQITGLSCPTSTSCIAVGYFLTTPGTGGGLVEQWNGTRWAALAAPSMDAVSCVTPTACTGVGRIVSLGYESVVVAHWGGTSWTPLATLASGDSRDASYGPLNISCVRTRCMIAGGFGDDLGDVFPVVWNWNGSAWAGVPTPPLGGGYGSAESYYFDSVSCAGRGLCTAVGATPGELNLAERWNGTAWRLQTTPNVVGAFFLYLAAVSCADGRHCMAVGNEGAERWTPNGWTLTTPIAAPPG
jgi:hypothetical protein